MIDKKPTDRNGSTPSSVQSATCISIDRSISAFQSSAFHQIPSTSFEPIDMERDRRGYGNAAVADCKQTAISRLICSIVRFNLHQINFLHEQVH